MREGERYTKRERERERERESEREIIHNQPMTSANSDHWRPVGLQHTSGKLNKKVMNNEISIYIS